MCLEIILRPARSGDELQIHALLADGLVAQTTATIPANYALADAQKWVAEAATSGSFVETFERVIELENLGRIVGVVSCKEIARRTGNVAYWIAPEFWGAGIATRALAHLIRYQHIISHYDSLEGGHLVGNPASGVVLRRNGFVRAGTREVIWRGAGRESLEIYRLGLPR